MSQPNIVTYGGNLTRDPEIRYTLKGTACCDITIANTEKWTAENGQKKERTCFAGATIWGKSGEVFAQYHKKGQQCLVSGKLTQETWEDKESGKKREKTKILVDQWYFVGGKLDCEKTSTSTPAPMQSVPIKQSSNPDEPRPLIGEPTIPIEDDVPF
jgi:single-strand DNA-binding protein